MILLGCTDFHVCLSPSGEIGWPWFIFPPKPVEIV